MERAVYTVLSDQAHLERWTRPSATQLRRMRRTLRVPKSWTPERGTTWFRVKEGHAALDPSDEITAQATGLINPVEILDVLHLQGGWQTAPQPQLPDLAAQAVAPIQQLPNGQQVADIIDLCSSSGSSNFDVGGSSDSSVVGGA